MTTNQSSSGPTLPDPEPAGPPPGQRPGEFFGWIRSFGVRRGGDRWMGGVASGLAHRWGVDPVLVRGLFIIAAIFLGIGVLAYGILWLLLPEPDGRIHVQEASRGRWTAGMTGGLIVSLIGLGGARAGFWFGENGLGGTFWGIFWVAVIGFAVYSIVRGSHGKKPGMQGLHGRAGHYPQPAAGVPHPGDDYYTKPGTPASSAWPGAWAAAPTDATAPLAPPPYYGGSLPPFSAQAPVPGHMPVPDPVPVPDPMPVAPKRRGPGGAFTAVVLGIAVLAAGTLVALNLAGAASISGAAIWTAAGIVVGAGIIAAGIRGRTAGILTLAAVIALVSGGIWQGVDRFGTQPARVDFAPATVQEASRGAEVSVTQGRVDLTRLDDAGPLASSVTVPIESVMSTLTVEIPRGVPVEVRADSTMSSIDFGQRSLAGITRNESQMYNADRPGPALVVRIEATMSTVHIEQER